MLTYDQLLTKVSQTEDDTKRGQLALAVSALPLLALTAKLIQRKQAGKKPFSEGFEYTRRLNLLHDDQLSLMKTLSKASWDSAGLIKPLKDTQETLQQASKEISSPSLLGDFVWAEKEISALLAAFQS
jgi:hypothetical protein